MNGKLGNAHTGPVERVYIWKGPPRLELTRQKITLPSGQCFSSHSLIANSGKTGVVAVAGDNERIILVRQFRPSAGRTLLELPRGFGEAAPGDFDGDEEATWRADAERELLEETGYEAVSSNVLGNYISDSALFPCRVAAVAINVDPSQVPHEHDGEVKDVVWISRASLPAMVREGAFSDAHTLSALSLLWASYSGHQQLAD